MPMSKDRVHFLLKDNQANHSDTARAAAKAFGMSVNQAQSALRNGYHNPMKVVCRPSQFARFLIYRSQSVSNNAFSQFEAELHPEQCENTMDVSGNPAERC